MPRPIHCILLIDDDPDDNFLHQLIIDESNQCDAVRVVNSGVEALTYLTQISHPDYIRPDVVFVDINMPGMNGFEFLTEYQRLNSQLKGHVVVVMLTTSISTIDKQRASSLPEINSYRTKPLTLAMINELVATYFS
ncbi:response regulator [Spirosoma fluviale]|uniref:CheY chemotaxis protein or a CheY-like REC (Receiver) domain n=1 Tax=Spirosoma fluviale TaxID=1597977 RepID=A0A286FGK0_9BACT|nr:response regulator [Spirosoma fluviale]SOD81934.1 CheY chemotaxis protein or a CheY-like REC (receiver) domain [Spirosoma fluviale]